MSGPSTEAWIAIEVTLAAELIEPVTNRMFELGAEGIDESDAQTAAPMIRGFFPTVEGDALSNSMREYLVELATMQPSAATASVRWQDVPMQNWAESHREFYPAQKLSNLFFLQPAWEKDTVIPEGMIPIILEPGQAFGTGLHPSTLLALLFLEWLVDKSPKPVSSLRVLDVGTGTGILAIAAAKLGVGYVEAMDIDPIAVDVAKENAAHNGCPKIHIHGTRLENIEGEFDLVLANILLEAHRAMAGDYARLLVPGGDLVLSGLLGQQKDDAESILRSVNVEPNSSKSMQEWIAISAVRKQD